MEKLNFKNFKINWGDEVDLDSESKIATYSLTAWKDAPIKFMDEYRANLGFTDGACSSDNEVYYNFYLKYKLGSSVPKLIVVVNHSEKDDFAEYEFNVNISWYEMATYILSRTLLMQI